MSRTNNETFDPLFVLSLSWLVILLEGFNGLQIAADTETDWTD